MLVLEYPLGRAKSTREERQGRQDYGVAIPISFSAASIRSGGAILIVSAWPVSNRLYRLDRIAGQPVRPPDRMSSLMSRSCDCSIVSFTASPACSIS